MTRLSNRHTNPVVRSGSAGSRGQPQLVNDEKSRRAGQSELRRIVERQLALDAEADPGNHLVERPSLHHERDLEALGDVPPNIARDDDVRRVAQRARDVGQKEVLAGPRRCRESERFTPICGENLVAPSAHAAEVRPAMRMVGGSVDTKAARDVRAHRSGTQVWQRANDVLRREGPVTAVAAAPQRRRQNLFLDRHAAIIHVYKYYYTGK